MGVAGGKLSQSLEGVAGSHVNFFVNTRRRTEEICAPLETGDYEPQSMPDASPVKWHLAHTTWFFDVFVLEAFESQYQETDPHYRVLFNSYYTGVGERQLRAERGLLTRPTLAEVLGYRRAVEQRVLALLGANHEHAATIQQRVELGCHHEQQHQELILTDVKHLFSRNRTAPTYLHGPIRGVDAPVGSARFLRFEGGLVEMGHVGDGFRFDNEEPRHTVFLRPFEISDRLVTNGEFRNFIEDRGYQRPELWLDAGFAHAQQEGWNAPLYWRKNDGGYTEFTLRGERRLFEAEPVSHISYYEADAFARWAGARLPSEQEWELATSNLPIAGNFAEFGRLHPQAADQVLHALSTPPSSGRYETEDASAVTSGAQPRGRDERSGQWFGDVWQWTQSPYSAYPGYRPAPGALGEYNGKFMCNQMVLRGGSCVTPQAHVRNTYRNFFHPKDRWQFSGLRLARDV